MNIILITFTTDQASMNERGFLESHLSYLGKKFDNYPVLEKKFSENHLFLLNTDKESVHYENLDISINSQIQIKPDLIIFCTKHQSASGIHSLSTHSPGNWGNADYGGEKGKVSVNPVAFTNIAYLKLKEINEQRNLNYEVIMECTHHGPYLETPSAFIEIGSNIESWEKADAGKAIADVLMEILPHFDFHTEKISGKLPVAIGFGGLHHSPEFTKRIERKETYISHVCPKYMLGAVEEKTILDALDRSVPKANLFLIDWKGLGENKDRVMQIIEKISRDNNIEIKKTKDFK